MSTPLIVTLLLLERPEIEAQIDSLNAKLSEARADLLQIAAVVRLQYPAVADGRPAEVYHGVIGAIERSDLFVPCKIALEAFPEPLDSRQLARQSLTMEG